MDADEKEAPRLSRLRFCFTVWKKRSSLAILEETLAEKTRLTRNDDTIDRKFRYWRGLSRFSHKMRYLSGHMRERKHFMNWFDVVAQRRELQKAVKKMILFRRSEYLRQSIVEWNRVRRLIAMLGEIQPRMDAQLCGRVFRALRVLRLKSKRDDANFKKVEAVTETRIKCDCFTHWSLSVSFRRKTRYFERRTALAIKMRYLAMLEQQKRTSKRLRMCLVKMHKSNDQARLSKAFFRWQDKHFDISGLCQKHDWLCRKIALASMKRAMGKLKARYKCNRRLQNAGIRLQERLSSARAYEYSMCFRLWKRRYSERAKTKNRECCGIQAFILAQKRRYTRRWCTRLMKQLEVKCAMRYLREIREKNVTRLMINCWRQRWVVRCDQRITQSDIKRMQFKMHASRAFTAMKIAVSRSKCAVLVESRRKARLIKASFDRLHGNLQRTRRCVYLVSAVLRNWSERVKRRAIDKWMTYIRSKRSRRVTYEEAGEQFDMYRRVWIIRGFVAGCGLRRSVKPPAVASSRPLNRVTFSSVVQEEVIELEAQLRAMNDSGAPVVEVITLLKRINAIRAEVPGC